MNEKLNAEWIKQIELFKKGEPIDWEKLKRLEEESKKFTGKAKKDLDKTARMLKEK